MKKSYFLVGSLTVLFLLIFAVSAPQITSYFYNAFTGNSSQQAATIYTTNQPVKLIPSKYFHAILDVETPVSETVDQPVTEPIVSVIPSETCGFAPVTKDSLVKTGFPTSPQILPNLSKLTAAFDSNKYNCKNYAFDLCESIWNERNDISCQVISFDHQLINKLEYSAPNGIDWVCFMIPKTGEYYCMKKSQWKNVPGGQLPWVRDTLCKKYFGYGDNCNSVTVTPVEQVGSCDSEVGQYCDAVYTQYGLCTTGKADANNPLGQLQCQCGTEKGEKVCRWH